MDLQPSLPDTRTLPAPARRFLALFLPSWPTDYLKRHEPGLAGPLALYERIKGGLRLAALDADAMAHGLRTGQNLADARAMLPGLTVRELDRPLLQAAFAEFADWHSNASPLVAVIFGLIILGVIIALMAGRRRDRDVAVDTRIDTPLPPERPLGTTESDLERERRRRAS